MELINHKSSLNLTEKLAFLMKFIASPSQIGSIMPSSKFLANKALQPIDWKTARTIAELGAGTGAFTKYIHSLKHQDCKVAVFEKDEEMRHGLKTTYPELMYFDNALHLSERLESVGIISLDVVLSDLPFTLFEETVRERIMDEVLHCLQPNGVFVAFQYSLQMKSMLARKFSRVDISFVPLNLPPAFVYVCHK